MATKKKTTGETEESVFDNLIGGKISEQIIPESHKLIYVETKEGELLLYPHAIIPAHILETITGLEFE